MASWRRKQFKDDEINSLKWEFMGFAKAAFYEAEGKMILSNEEKKNVSFIFNWLVGREIDLCKNKGLLLTGPYGTGKSVLLKACIKFINKYYSDKTLPYKGIPEPIYILSHEMTNAFMEEKGSLISRMKTTSILAIDDLGYEPAEVKSFGTIIKPFEEVLMARYDNRKTIILSTNLCPEELGERYKGHILDRLRQMTYLIEFKGESKR